MTLPASRRSAREYQRAMVESASPTELVVILYDGAIRFVAQARALMPDGDREARNTALVKAQRIVGELLSTLDREAGEPVVTNLSRVYAYMLRLLVEANLHDRPEPLDEVAGLLRELREAWSQMEQQARTASNGSA
ncbi:MAG TPA: flagellar export chaperone FliS [Chthonomonadales bacterium]|nr:flagellar export chaperone FliS [Chthonomonadales bacterium]